MEKEEMQLKKKRKKRCCCDEMLVGVVVLRWEESWFELAEPCERILKEVGRERKRKKGKSRAIYVAPMHLISRLSLAWIDCEDCGPSHSAEYRLLAP